MTDLSGKTVWVMAKGFAPDEGGHQTYAEQVALAYARRGADVSVFTQTSVGPRHADQGGLRLIDLGPGKGVSIPVQWLRALRAERRRAGHLPDFVHATTWRTAIPPLVLGHRAAVTFHGREFMYARNLAFKLMAWVARKASPLVAVSRYSAERLVGRLGSDGPIPIVAWNGVSISPLPRSPADANSAPLVLSLCRLEPRKNIPAAVRAASQLAKRGYVFRYVICGRGPDLETIRTLVERHGMNDRIHVAGYVDAARARRLYSEADIFIHPQIANDEGRDFEGFGIAIADAAIAGCATIVGSEGGPAELIVDGESGLVVDGGDDNAIAGAIALLLDDPGAREEVALCGQARAAELMSWDRHVRIVLPEHRPSCCPSA